MNSDLPPNTKNVVIERPVKSNPLNNYLGALGKVELPGLGGVLASSTGTAVASSATVSSVQIPGNTYFIPEAGPNPQWEMELQNWAENDTLDEEIREK